MAPRCLSMSYVCVLFNFNTLVYLRNAVLRCSRIDVTEAGSVTKAISSMSRLGASRGRLPGALPQVGPLALGLAHTQQPESTSC